jgi:hypothetical protein
MLHTYKATLRGNYLEWDDTPPEAVTADQPVAVHVTILEEASSPATATVAGVQMAAILEQLAHQPAFAEIEDPAAWERELRVG